MTLLNTDGSFLSRGTTKMILPSKPFTIEEAKAISQVSTKNLEAWLGLTDGLPQVLKLQYTEHGQGLWDMGVLALMAGQRHLDEGLPASRAAGVVCYVALMSLDGMLMEFAAGNTFPVPACVIPGCQAAGVLVPNPGGRFGDRCDLKNLYEEFQHRLTQVFPRG